MHVYAVYSLQRVLSGKFDSSFVILTFVRGNSKNLLLLFFSFYTQSLCQGGRFNFKRKKRNNDSSHTYVRSSRGGVLGQCFGYTPDDHNDKGYTCEAIFAPHLIVNFSSLFSFIFSRPATYIYSPQPMKTHIFSLMMSPEKVFTTSTYRYSPAKASSL